MIKAIYQKEVLELVREKKTLMFMILLPLLIFPAIFGGLAFFATKTIQESNTRVLTFYVSPDLPDNPLVKVLTQSTEYQLDTQYTGQSEAQIKDALKNGALDFWLQIDPEYQTRSAKYEQSEWVLVFNNADGLNAPLRRVTGQLNEINQSLTQAKLSKLDLTAEQIDGVLKPIKLKQNNLAESRQSMGSLIGGFIPYVLLPLCLVGAIYPAIDLAAGEKERGTIESLLIAPVARWQLVMGKYLTVLTASMGCVVITLFSLMLWGFIFAQGFAVEAIVKLANTFGLGSILLSVFMMFPVALFISALVMTISIYAKNYKEAQNFMAPLSFLIFAPLIIAMLPGIELNWSWAWVPISNVALAIKEILKGQADVMMLALVWASQLALAAAMLGFCVYWFSREKVLFR